MISMTIAQQAKTVSILPPTQGILQRTCACGKHSVAGGECGECAKKKNGLQRKLGIGSSNDPLEREADQVADQVMTASVHSVVSGAPPRIQRYSGQASENTDTVPASVDRVLVSSGRPLEMAMRLDMEQRFGHDFSQVRVHSGAAAEQSARDVNANAYTVGHNVVFGAGRFAPGTHEGRRLIAHELTHVVQQRDTHIEKPRALAVSAPRGPDEQLAVHVPSRIGQLASLPTVVRSAAKPATMQRQVVLGAVSDPGASRLLVSCDTDRPDKKQRCNIDQLTKLAVEALSSSDRAVIRVLGVEATGTKDLDPRGTAFGHADGMLRALIQWIGPNKYPETRFETGFATGTKADPQVQIWVSYQPQIRSPHPKGPLPGSALIGPPQAPAAAAGSSLPDIGLSKFTNYELDIEIGDLKIVLPKSAELKFKGLPYKKFPNQPSKTLQISIKGEVGKFADLFKSPNKSADPASPTPAPITPTRLGPPVKLSMSVTLNGLKQIGFDLSAKADFSNQTITGGLSLTLAGSGCGFKVPATAFAKIWEAEKALRKLSPEPGRPPTADEMLKNTQEAQKKAETAVTVPAQIPNAPRGAVQSAAAPEAASAFDPGQLADIADIANTLYEAISEIDKEKTKCQKGPTIKIGPTITAPFGSDDPIAPPDPDRRPNVGVGVTGEF